MAKFDQQQLTKDAIKKIPGALRLEIHTAASRPVFDSQLLRGNARMSKCWTDAWWIDCFGNRAHIMNRWSYHFLSFLLSMSYSTYWTNSGAHDQIWCICARTSPYSHGRMGRSLGRTCDPGRRDKNSSSSSQLDPKDIFWNILDIVCIYPLFCGMAKKTKSRLKTYEFCWPRPRAELLRFFLQRIHQFGEPMGNTNGIIPRQRRSRSGGEGCFPALSLRQR